MYGLITTAEQCAIAAPHLDCGWQPPGRVPVNCTYKGALNLPARGECLESSMIAADGCTVSNCTPSDCEKRCISSQWNRTYDCK